MQELWRLKNDLPAYLSTAAAWLGSVELDRNDMAGGVATRHTNGTAYPPPTHEVRTQVHTHKHNGPTG